jgi:hypothetical protein
MKRSGLPVLACVVIPLVACLADGNDVGVVSNGLERDGLKLAARDDDPSTIEQLIIPPREVAACACPDPALRVTPPTDLSTLRGCGSEFKTDDGGPTVDNLLACMQSLVCALDRIPTMEEIIAATRMGKSPVWNLLACTESTDSGQPATPPNDLRCIFGSDTLWCSILLNSALSQEPTIECVNIFRRDQAEGRDRECGTRPRSIALADMCKENLADRAREEGESQTGCETCHRPMTRDGVPMTVNGDPCYRFFTDVTCPNSNQPPEKVWAGTQNCDRLSAVVNEPCATAQEIANAQRIMAMANCSLESRQRREDIPPCRRALSTVMEP